LVSVAGCHKRHQANNLPEETAPAAATAPAGPTAQLTANPDVISAGEQVQLSWHTTDVTSARIDGIGEVPTQGVKTVTPTASTSYHLLASGPDGTAEATARVTVNAPSSAAASAPVSSMGSEEEFKANVQDIFYGYDTYELSTEAQATLSHDASYLVNHPDVKVIVGGYCDERGSNEYNLALGQNRADAAKNALVSAGISASRIRVISYGKEKPFCTEANEECWQQNRRAGFTLDR
jgi:peptidoglycan-associated lipoprotein